MSRAQRVGLAAVVLALVAGGFLLARPADDDDPPGPVRAGDVGETTPRDQPGERPPEPTATTDARPEQRIVLRDHAPVGGPARIEVARGDFVRLVVESDAPDEIHVHGYDVDGRAAPREPFRVSFRAEVEGVFEIERHAAEDGGGELVIARLVVAPA
ncbi:MAG: hypothetical protein ACR2GL_06575 [Thermoleophilaceae bacterium]